MASFVYDGTRFWGPLTPITPNDQFYVVTKNVVDPDVSRGLWRLEIGGQVDHAGGVLVVSEVAYPGRVATVDGAPAPTLP